MQSINQSTLFGTLAFDPIITLGERNKAAFKVKTEKPYKDQNSGEWKSISEYTPCTVWGIGAKAMEGAKAGDLILVEGRTNTRSWETEDGEKKYSTEVNVSKLTLLIEKTFQADPDEEQPQQQEPSVKRTEIKKLDPLEEISIEDVPF